MTLIECFDREPVENIAGCLHLQPKKLIFLGNEKQMRQSVKRFEQFFTQRNLDTKVVLRDVHMEDMDHIICVLTDIVRSEKECVIDVTGGESPVLMAVGAVVASLNKDQRQKVSVQNAAISRDTSISLSVQELVALHGGIVHPRVQQPPHSFTPEDLAPLWNAVRKDPRGWNKQISVLSEFERRSEIKDDIYLPLEQLSGSISDFEEKESLVRDILDKLHHCGVIHDRSSYHTLRYSYTDPILRECVKKAGNVLEIKTLLQARSLRQNGKPYFTDCQMSVTIDWDGIVHDPMDRIPETRNEIDLILTRGMVPLFISCKNGNIGEEELYKLNTVATRFGSRYARKMLIATDLEQKGAFSNQAFIQRAKDMNIYLVSDAALLSDQGWDNALKRAMEG